MGIIFLSEPVTTQRVIGATFVIGALIALTLLENRDEAKVPAKTQAYVFSSRFKRKISASAERRGRNVLHDRLTRHHSPL
jgi:hypothetical protein